MPGAVQSPRLAGRPPLSKWPRVSRVAGHSGRVAGGLAAPSEAVFWAKLRRGGLHRPKSDRFCPKMALEGADGQAALEIRRPADLNDARKRGRSPSADRRRGWARGGLPRTASPRAPPPEARRAEERGRTPRRTPPIFTRAALPEGHRPAWVQRPLAEAEASERPRASSTRSPAVDAEGVTAGRGMASPRRRPRHAAPAAGPWPKRGRPSPERSEAERGSA